METDSNKKILRTGFFKGKELTDTHVVFPSDLGKDEDAIKNCIMFSVFNYAGGGYNRLSKDGSSDLVTKPVGDRKISVFLPMPAGIGVSESAGWENTDQISGRIVSGISTAKGAAMDGKSFLAKMDGLIKTASDSVGSVSNAFLTEALSSRILSNANMRNSFSAATGVGIQPYEEMLFNNIGFRKFSFSFKMVPRNDKELQRIADIVQIFRWASKPGLTAILDALGTDNTQGAKIFSYPNIFQLRYLMGTDEAKENPWLNKFQPACCHQVDVEYGGDQSRNYMSFVPNSHPLRKAEERQIDPEGAPLFYRLSLSFSELAYVTKESINQGY